MPEPTKRVLPGRKMREGGRNKLLALERNVEHATVGLFFAVDAPGPVDN